eukprot:CAMPEP_0119029398 /NCGR_PEP_ID=MMETSP1176-20130426/40495_1 /TAXON_ID=265551 /ORGANISM="Synedropsis recta cf, Strain CCMP1620" /LENGTH=680 /DNA_ID=CAMNT_0006985737 /DNA_START=20 /DNA_END=2062 /DNA_ORIENTATION=+
MLMQRILALFLSSATATILVSGQAWQACSICGEGQQVGSPFEVFSFPGQPAFLCGSLEKAGEDGLIPFDQCPLLPSLLLSSISNCNCLPIGVPPTPSPPPTPAAPTQIPTPLPPFECSVCGVGRTVGSPDNVINDALFSIQDGQPITCAELEAAGNEGLIPRNECNPSIIPSVLEVQIVSSCDCVSIDDSAGSCSICGEGKKVGDPDAIFSFPGQPDIPCGILEKAGEDGLIPLAQCPFLASLVASTCGCFIDGPTTAPTTAPTFGPDGVECSVCGVGRTVGSPDNVINDALFSIQDGQPITCAELEAAGNEGLIPRNECNPSFVISVLQVQVVSSCDCVSIDDSAGSCSICGEGKKVGDPDAIFSFPGQPDIPCGILEKAGEDGLIPLVHCPFLASLVGVCECADAPSSAPVAPTFICSVCGTGKEVGAPETFVDSTVFLLDDQTSTISCGVLEDAGNEGLIPEEHCMFLPALIHHECGCRRTIDDVIVPVSCPVCGYGRVVGAPDSVYELAGQPPISCGALEAAGEEGLINECFVIPLLVGRQCGCRALDEDAASYCSICGTGLEVGAPDNIETTVENSAVQRLTCQDYEYAGESGLFPECQELPSIFSQACECRAASGPTSPSPVAIQGSTPPPPVFTALSPSAPSSSEDDGPKAKQGMSKKGMMMKKSRVLRSGSE